jgi:hypothetical protein
MEVHACNPSTQEAEAGGLWVQDQPRLYTNSLFQNVKNKMGELEVYLSGRAPG